MGDKKAAIFSEKLRFPESKGVHTGCFLSFFAQRRVDAIESFIYRNGRDDSAYPAVKPYFSPKIHAVNASFRCSFVFLFTAELKLPVDVNSN
jgi:hypothetical protein